jgi:hypothetical protein
MVGSTFNINTHVDSAVLSTLERTYTEDLQLLVELEVWLNGE